MARSMTCCGLLVVSIASCICSEKGCFAWRVGAVLQNSAGYCIYEYIFVFITVLSSFIVGALTDFFTIYSLRYQKYIKKARL